MSLLVKSNPAARALSETLREGDGPFLSDRRRITALMLGASASMGVIVAYQMGLIRHLPDPPVPTFDADRVDASAQAYRYGSAPDGTWGLLNYGATIVLAAMGGADRAERHPWLPLALAAKVGADAAGAAKLTVDQWTKHRAFCGWCLAAAGATFAALPAVLPEAKAAWRRLRS
jgi:uncharacterized membrane protein